MANNEAAININRDVLVRDLGLKQYRNTTIYTRSNVFVLSPSSQNSYNWFDLRKVNLDRYDSSKVRGHLLVRFHDVLLWADLNEFMIHMTAQSIRLVLVCIGSLI
jgi:hypothetical protein